MQTKGASRLCDTSLTCEPLVGERFETVIAQPASGLPRYVTKSNFAVKLIVNVSSVALSTHTTGRPLPTRLDFPSASGISALVTLAIIVIIVGALYFGSDIFVPLALAMLLSFALAPPVRWLRRISVPNLLAVLSVVSVAFLLILVFVWILSVQAMDIAQRLPTYRTNLETKIDSVFQSPPGGRLFERAAEMVRDLGRKIEEEQEAPTTQQATSAEVEEEQPPLPVEIQEAPLTPLQIITTVVGPLVSPLATAGIVIVFVIFILLKREDLRDRFIRLAGSRDLPRTTQALDDAARRVGRYLLMQVVVNTTYALPIGIGLWLIGVPNPVLWGMLCGLLRFVPYIGPIVASFFPLALAIAVDPGWTTFLLAAAWFIVVELISNNVVEPWLWSEHGPLADCDHRRGGVLDVAVGPDWPAAFNAADRLPGGSRAIFAAAYIP
jgi:predicted PurR-regulated permease PerM